MPETKDYNPDIYWNATADSYPHYPTVRHRKRYILRTLKKSKLQPSFSLFDFGCGEGTLLTTIQKYFSLPDNHVGGCDISKQAIDIAQTRLQSPHLYNDLFPVLSQKFDVMLCSEVIEHTTEYESVLRWMADNLNPNGIMIVTTQAGRIHASDRYTGHTQHFTKKELRLLLEKINMQNIHVRLWGWPLFTMQKYLTNINFKSVQSSFLEGKMSLCKRVVFTAAYLGYFVHDLIPFGPQLYITARKK